jgi:hypothetical protein
MQRADIAFSIDAVRLAHVRVQHFNVERSHASEIPGLPLLKQAPIFLLHKPAINSFIILNDWYRIASMHGPVGVFNVIECMYRLC